MIESDLIADITSRANASLARDYAAMDVRRKGDAPFLTTRQVVAVLEEYLKWMKEKAKECQ